jgi:hypothetical protein
MIVGDIGVVDQASTVEALMNVLINFWNEGGLTGVATPADTAFHGNNGGDTKAAAGDLELAGEGGRKGLLETNLFRRLIPFNIHLMDSEQCSERGNHQKNLIETIGGIRTATGTGN